MISFSQSVDRGKRPIIVFDLMDVGDKVSIRIGMRDTVID